MFFLAVTIPLSYTYRDRGLNRRDIHTQRQKFLNKRDRGQLGLPHRIV